MSALSEQECQNELLKNIDLNISIVAENKVEPSSDGWTVGQDIWNIFQFLHWKISAYIVCRMGKKKTLAWHILSAWKRKKIKSKGYLCSDSIFTKRIKNTFTIKAKCSASMKKIKRDVVVAYARKTSRVERAKCSCPAGWLVTAIM